MSADTAAPSAITDHPFMPKDVKEWWKTCCVCGLAEAAHAQTTMDRHGNQLHKDTPEFVHAEEVRDAGGNLFPPGRVDAKTGEPVDLNQGVKFDEGKARYDLIPAEALDELARLFATGAAKYEDRNWEKGLKFGRVFSAMMRHAWAWWRGERNDPEDGQHHLSSVAWCALVLMTLETTKPAYDDRPGKDNSEDRPDSPDSESEPRP